MQQGLLFASARAKAKELNLFTEERLYRVMEARTLKDAVRVLAEANYGGGMNITEENFYDALKEEERLTSEFLREAAPKGVGIECFFLLKDYHNLKVLVKTKRTNNDDYERMILSGGTYPLSELRERFDEGKIGYVNPYMERALKSIRKCEETDGLSPRKIDVELDKAAYEQIADILKGKNADKYIREYFVSSVDAINLCSYVRTAKIGAEFNFFEEGFLPGGEITLELFRECGFDVEKLCKKLERGKYKELLPSVKEGDLGAAETAKDDYLLRIFSVNKSDMFSVAPIVGYYLGKVNEVKVLRVVLSCIKNGVSGEEMKKRVRTLYA